MIKQVITLSSQENLWKAQNMMSRYNIKKIVIVTDSKKHPIGIVSLKDMIKFVISDKTDRDLHEIPISEAMTKNLIMANKNSIVTYCAKTMTENNVSSLIIVNEDDGKNDNYSLAGIVTTTDFANFFSENCIGLTSVELQESFFKVKEETEPPSYAYLITRLIQDNKIFARKLPVIGQRDWLLIYDDTLLELAVKDAYDELEIVLV
jgi:CBS domain-containing protein